MFRLWQRLLAATVCRWLDHKPWYAEDSATHPHGWHCVRCGAPDRPQGWHTYESGRHLREARRRMRLG